MFDLQTQEAAAPRGKRKGRNGDGQSLAGWPSLYGSDAERDRRFADRVWAEAQRLGLTREAA
jgi:hypothetical protein